MLLNGMEIRQANGVYYFFTEYAELKAQVQLPANQDILADFKCCDIISKALAIRWGIIQQKKK